MRGGADRSPGERLRIVGSGIDSLYLSARGELWDGLIEALRQVRAAATDEPVPIHMRDGDYGMLLRSHGWRGYPFWLSSPNFELFVGAAKPFPPVYTMLHSAFIHAVGVEVAVAEAQRFLEENIVQDRLEPLPSRIDVYADTQGWEPHADDFDRFICRGVRRRLFAEPAQLHGHGRRLSGFTFGKGDVVARIYDKTLELRSRGETWPAMLWREMDTQQPVWRIEFQFRRQALTTLGVTSVEDTLDRRQALWRYGTRWLSLRVPTDNVQRSRWPEDTAWLALREARIGSPCSPLVRERVRAANELRLLRGFAGYASSLAALHGEDDVHRALRRATPLVLRYLAERGVVFREVVARKRSRYIDVADGSR